MRTPLFTENYLADDFFENVDVSINQNSNEKVLGSF